ncbi:MAG: hypothetical protein H7259_10615 [Cytophagales bacterium]|nr:hypothetical protein [Cytophaga sp.]
MKRGILMIVSVLLYMNVQAQDTSSHWGKHMHMMDKYKEDGHFGYLGIGYQYTQFMGLPSGAQSIDGSGLALSLNHYKICHNMLFGTELGGVNGQTVNNDDMSARVYQGFIYANWGYLIYNKKETMIYPFIGFGGAFNGLSLKNKTATDMNFTDFSIKAGQKGNFSSSGVGINLGIGFKKSLMPCGSGYALQLGFDLGVRYMPYHSNWNYNGNDSKVDQLGTGENLAYYAKLTIGKGTFKK